MIHYHVCFDLFKCIVLYCIILYIIFIYLFVYVCSDIVIYPMSNVILSFDKYRHDAG